MKYFSKILFIVSLALGLSACNDILVPDALETGEIPVRITFSFADKAIQTKSKVSGTENRVHTMQMVCFDANGQFLGLRDAEVTKDTSPAAGFFCSGIIKGTVPENTARIHFIANRKLDNPLSHGALTAESVVMNSEELSTLYNDANHQEICFWGYHKESNATLMAKWLNPAEGTHNIVYMIRDRARVVLTYDSTGQPAGVTVTKIEWLIHNGRERGYLAPAEANWDNTNYYDYSTVEGHTNELVSTAGIHEYKTPEGTGRYSLWIDEDHNDENNFDQAYPYPSDSDTGTPQFLFEDDNADIDNVKVILRVTYSVSGLSSPKTVYHVLRLNDDDQNKYDIVRNNTYYIKCSKLSPDVAFYKTLKDAVNGEEFVNADVEVDRSIPDINDEQYTLQIKLPNEGSTSIVLNTTEENSDMQFVLRKVSDLSEVTTNPADFTVSWEKTQDFCTTPVVTYDGDTKQFVITTQVTNLTDVLQSEWMVVEYKYTGSDNKQHTLKRYIHVYVIDQFQYITPPTLTKSGDDYVLSFKIPKPEYSDPNNPDPSEYIYPIGLYPIDVKFTTNTLNAYGIVQNTNNYGLFGVGVEDTKKLCNSGNFETNYNSPISSTATADITHWYYQQANNYWDFWYSYSIKEYPTNGEVKIYFKDVRSHIKYASVADVGLFMYVEYFGKIYSIPGTN